MTPGLATRRALDRAARQHADEERRAVEMLGWLLTIVAAALIGTAAVLIADQLTGLQYVAELIRWVRS